MINSVLNAPLLAELVDEIRPTGYSIAHGVYPDMTEHGWPRDDWPALWERIEGEGVLLTPGTSILVGYTILRYEV